jgi:hypothetical protein
MKNKVQPTYEWGSRLIQFLSMCPEFANLRSQITISLASVEPHCIAGSKCLLALHMSKIKHQMGAVSETPTSCRCAQDTIRRSEAISSPHSTHPPALYQSIWFVKVLKTLHTAADPDIRKFALQRLHSLRLSILTKIKTKFPHLHNVHYNSITGHSPTSR